MTTATVTSKGQVTLPKELRDQMGLHQGDVIEFVEENGKTVLRRMTPAQNPLRRWIGAAPLPERSADWVRDLRGWDDWDRENFG